jgi:hypothetical protein
MSNGFFLQNKSLLDNLRFIIRNSILSIQGDSYSILQTSTSGRLQPLDTFTKMSRF